MDNPFAKVPAFPAVVGLCAGILTSTKFVPDITCAAVVALCVLSVIVTIVVWILTRTIMWTLPALAFGAGIVFGFNTNTNPLPEDIADARGTARAVIVKAKTTNETTRLIVDVTGWTPKGDSVEVETDFRVICSLRDFNDKLRPGMTLTLTGRIRPVRAEPDVPYQTDFNRYLAIDGVVGQMIVYPDDYLVVGNDETWLDRMAYQGRKAWLGAIADAGFDEPTTAFMLAVIGGNDLLLSEDVEQEFRNTGMAHVLAISGLHVGIIVVVLALVLYPVKLNRRLRPLYFFAIGAVILFYALIAGGSPSVCRAAVMCCVLMGYRLLEVRPNTYQSLSVAVLILLSINPVWIYMPGFQFSVCAVLAIITFAPRVDIVPRRYKVLRLMWMAMVLPVIAVVGTLALTVFYFHTFSLNFWVSNILGAIFIPVLVGCGFLAALLSLVGLSAGFSVTVCDTLYRWLEKTVATLDGMFPDSQIPMFLSGIEVAVIIFTLVIAGILVRHYSHRRFAFASLAIFAAGITAFVSCKNEEPPETEVYVPRHYGSTDVIIVHRGRSYIWSTATGRSEESMRRNLTTLYRDFFAQRGVNGNPHTLARDTVIDGLQLRGKVLKIRERKLALIDNPDGIDTIGHVDAAIVTDRFNAPMSQLVAMLDADTIYLHTSINYSRHEKFVRQLDTLDVVYRPLRRAPIVWQFR